ncbi:uncharacterized protein [Dysidea avara]|uniref:uncharacterized protein isoform X3 n=1 Tax=Dysidea avara TaxID=196820 RepID=UPI00331EE399
MAAAGEYVRAVGQQPYPKSHCSAVGLLTCIHFMFYARCSYLKDDNVGYFAVHTMADETWHSRVMAWWCKLVAVIFNIWSRLDLTASHCSTVCLLIHVQLFCARCSYLKDDDVGYFAVNTTKCNMVKQRQVVSVDLLLPSSSLIRTSEQTRLNWLPSPTEQLYFLCVCICIHLKNEITDCGKKKTCKIV